MPSTVKTQGLVLKKNELLNLDNLVTVFTKELGKITVVAKGIKKLNSRRAPHIQTLNLIDLVLYEKNDRYYLQESNMISGFTSIKKNSEKLSMAYYVFYIIDRLLPENNKEAEIYNLTLKLLANVSKELKKEKQLAKNYLNNLLKKLGYTTSAKSLEELHVLIEDLLGEKVGFFVI